MRANRLPDAVPLRFAGRRKKLGPGGDNPAVVCHAAPAFLAKEEKMSEPTVRLVKFEASAENSNQIALVIEVDGAQHELSLEYDDEGANLEPGESLAEYMEVLDEEDPEKLDEAGQHKFLLGMLIEELMSRVVYSGLIFPLTPEDLEDDEDEDEEGDEDE
jgi:hypothetical protein